MHELFESFGHYMSSFATRLIWNINIVQVLAERQCLQIYNNYAFVRNALHHCQSIWQCLFPKTYVSLLQDPEESAWIALLTNDNDDIYTSLQNLGDEPISEVLYASKFKLAANNLVNLKNRNNCCLIGKFHDRYCVQVSDVSPKLDNVKSSLSFLSIYYCHPTMKSKIELHVSDDMLFVGNELLNGTFVLRTLKMQSEPFVFDQHYEIQCIDSNVTEFSIFDNQYITVNVESFDIVTIN